MGSSYVLGAGFGSRPFFAAFSAASFAFSSACVIGGSAAIFNINASRQRAASSDSSDMPAFPNRCIFCGESRRSKEHIWPRWLGPHLPATMGKESHALLRAAPGEGVTIKPGSNHGSNHGYSKKLKIVCHRCNNEWMSGLQTRAKPWLEPLVRLHWPTFTSEGQRAIAAWVTMFTMVSEYLDHERAAVTQKELRRFMETQEALPEWRIWIGNYSRGHCNVINHHGMGVWSAFYDLEAPKVPNTQITTFNAGKALFHVFSTTNPRIMEDEVHFARRFGLTAIWPLGRPLIPPVVAHDYPGLMAISNDFPRRWGAETLDHREVDLPIGGDRTQ